MKNEMEVEELVERKAEKTDPIAVSNFKLTPGNHHKISSGQVLLGMFKGEKLCFLGGAKITPLIGSVEVMGYQFSSPIARVKGFNSKPIIGELSKSSSNVRNPFNLSRLPLKEYPCYSSLTHAVLNIEAVETKESSNQAEPTKNNKKVNGLLPFSIYHKSCNLASGQHEDFTDSNKELRELLAREIPELFSKAVSFGLTSPFSSLILLSDVTPTQFQKFQGSRAFQTEARQLKNIFTPSDIPRFFPGFYPIVESIPYMTALHAPEAWTDSCLAFAQTASDYVQGDSSEYPTAVVSGTKNSGKSIFSKLLVNKLLASFPAVAYINCDIGQTEFTAPGVLALHFLTEPILGPPFTQLRQPAQACYLGDTHTKNCTAHFFDAVSHFLALVQGQTHSFFTASRSPIPIVINTSGWTKGAGLNIFQKLIRLAVPSHVFQLGQGEQLVPGIIRLPIVNYDFSPTHQRFTPEHHRTLSLTSYLLSCPTGWCHSIPLTLQTPKIMPWSQVEFWVLSGDLDVSQTLYAFSGSIVGVYTSANLLPSPPTQTILPPKLVKSHVASFPPPAHYNCIGLALIRGIDRSTGMLHLITPLSEKAMSQVVAIAKGSQCLPHELMDLANR
ncbi:Polynucleotide 5'-hydroxyl-kinase grc3 [Entomophthora muscae]|uniref:Polynucleotide 5'-hydroxyl-kinase grc3 n=1 Tax=Entomophthora muscae TaxID=34485 RepID=A0ACC2U1W8_9FUNG|nr:Polynucleotide 5'-hydroxyl-kinase grc3 [Entomophthora muscae]